MADLADTPEVGTGETVAEVLLWGRWRCSGRSCGTSWSLAPTSEKRSPRTSDGAAALHGAGVDTAFDLLGRGENDMTLVGVC